MTHDELIQFHERQYKDEKSKRVTLGDDLTYKATAYAETLRVLRSYERIKHNYYDLKADFDRIIDVLDDMGYIKHYDNQWEESDERQQ